MKVRFRCPPELKGILPEPYPARRGLPDWLKEMSAAAFCPDIGEDIRTVKHCPPFIDAMGFGFVIPLAADVRVENGRFEWAWAPEPSTLGRYSRSPLGIHLKEQLSGAPFADDDYSAIKFSNFWTIETEPGYSLLAGHPFNREELPFRTLTGIVDTDRYKDGCIQFPALWLDADFSGTLPRGTPIAQCVPVQREVLDLEFGELVDEAAERFIKTLESINEAPGAYRRLYRAAKQ